MPFSIVENTLEMSRLAAANAHFIDVTTIGLACERDWQQNVSFIPHAKAQFKKSPVGACCNIV